MGHPGMESGSSGRPPSRDETVGAAGIILFDMLAYANTADFPSRLRDGLALVQAGRAPATKVDTAFAELRQLAEEALAAMRGILAVPLGTRIQTGDSAPDEQSDTKRASYLAELNGALDVVRRNLRQHESSEFENFVRMIQSRDRDLGARLEETLREYLAYTREVERTLVLFGAGTDDDVDLIGDLVPDVA